MQRVGNVELLAAVLLARRARLGKQAARKLLKNLLQRTRRLLLHPCMPPITPSPPHPVSTSPPSRDTGRVTNEIYSTSPSVIKVGADGVGAEGVTHQWVCGGFGSRLRPRCGCNTAQSPGSDQQSQSARCLAVPLARSRGRETDRRIRAWCSRPWDAASLAKRWKTRCAAAARRALFGARHCSDAPLAGRICVSSSDTLLQRGLRVARP